MGEQRIKTILMDCDGVLVDSEMIYLTSLVHYLKLLGIDTTIDDLAYLVGSDIESITEKVRRQFGLEQYSVQELIDGQRRQFDEEFSMENISEMPGLTAFLEEMNRQDIELAVVSSSSTSYVEQIVSHLGLGKYFKVILGKESAGKAKPAPELYLKALEIMRADVETTVVIEDSKNGILAGKSAGCKVIAYCGSRIKQDVSEADRKVRDYREAAELML